MTDDELIAKIPPLKSGAAMITGAASGVGLACARRFAGLGMPLVLADRDAEKLESAAKEFPAAIAVAADVSKQDDLQRLCDQAFVCGPVSILMNNAGASIPAKATSQENWRSLFDVNFFPMIEATSLFAPAMIAQGTPGLIINTGSKQGITTPPGNPAYNASKSAVKTFTEALAYELRNTPDCKLSAHLLVPGYTYSGMTAASGAPKPASAWTAGQVADFMLESIAHGDFYILCPDNDTPRSLDEKRMEWAMGDLIHNRPPLSRWHPDYKQAFEQFIKS